MTRVAAKRTSATPTIAKATSPIGECPPPDAAGGFCERAALTRPSDGETITPVSAVGDDVRPGVADAGATPASGVVRGATSCPLTLDDGLGGLAAGADAV